MIIPSIQEVRDLDQETIKKEPIASIDLMERASRRFCNEFLKGDFKPLSVLVFCGPGNNGGDGLAIARILSETGLNVDISIINPEKGSSDFKANLTRVPKRVKSFKIIENEDLKRLSHYPCIIDGIFGSGLTRAIEGVFADAINWINESEAEIYSIDIPSGMFGDKANDVSDPIVNADWTYSFQFQKSSFMMPYQGSFTGEVEVLDIGILPEAIERMAPERSYFEAEDARILLKRRKKFSHKGSYGHGLLISGSLGKMGAAALAGKAAFRSGLGLLTIHSPKCGVQIVQESLNEAMVSEDNGTEHLYGCPPLDTFDGIAIGPGIGTAEETADMMEYLLKEVKSPMVIDADALNILSSRPSLFKKIPKNSILTPHPGEFKRMVNNWKDDYQRLELQWKFADKYECIVVLKGANTSIAFPNGVVSFNSSGNPGMATAGSGDVLTGILLGLLAQGYSSNDASLLGVYLHGLAGDLGVQKRGFEGLIASDIVEFLSPAFKSLY
jgi:ADP-dependent NAD(P)H-hydrate dehydratase / NAD(P)H-hydrate epimerase